ncbi:hypothetical protein RR47_GL001648 [Enterococcus columbae DSM 7374 = ATCC 51263]|nr:hypothetical protein RR47_GL001648 [Enterococcus columbae DSM 7374 = ATCC 51263]
MNSLINCLLRTSLERGQRRLPEPPESKIKFIIFSPLSLLQELFSTLANLSFHLLGGFLIFCTDRDVSFQLRFCAGRSHHDGAVIFQQELEHIGLGQTTQTGSVVQQLHDLLATKLLDVSPERLHNVLHLGKTSAAVELVAVQGVQAVAIGLVQFIQLVQQADALGGIVAEHLADHVGTIHAVLVADVGAGQITIAFLKAEHIAICLAMLFQLANLLADKLEAGQHIDGTQAVMSSNLLAHIHGDDRLDHNRVGRHLAVLYTLAANVVQQQHTGLVAGQQLILACLVLDSDAHTVTVGVGCQQQVGIALLGILHAQCHSFLDLRVRVRAGQEVAIRLLLLLDHRDVAVAHLLQGASHRLQTGAIQRAVHDGHILINLFTKQNRLTLDLFHEGGVDLIRDVLDAAVCHACFKITGLDVCKDIQFFNLRQNFRSSLSGDLAAVRTVDLIAVILARVVRSRHHDTCGGVQITGRKRHGRNRHQDRPDIDLNTIGCEHARCHLCKHIALDAAVIADGHRRLCEVLFQIISQTLRSFRYGVDVHPIGACANYATQTTGAKSKITIKSILNFCIIHRFQFSGNICIRSCIHQPSLVFFFNIHNSFTPLKVSLYLCTHPYGWYFFFPMLLTRLSVFLCCRIQLPQQSCFLLHTTSIEYTRLYSSIAEVLLYIIEPRIPLQ